MAARPPVEALTRNYSFTVNGQTVAVQAKTLQEALHLLKQMI